MQAKARDVGGPGDPETLRTLVEPAALAFCLPRLGFLPRCAGLILGVGLLARATFGPLLPGVSAPSWSSPPTATRSVVLTESTGPPARDGGRLPASPAGVNVGGWLSLEDWFFSGNRGRFIVSPNASGSGACLPPAVVGGLDAPWPSEGILVNRLVRQHGEKAAIRAFQAHRHSFMVDSDLEDMASLGIRSIRVPIVWAVFADALTPIDPKSYGAHNPDTDAAIVPDPLYPHTSSFVTVPRSWLVQFLKKAKAHGLKVLFEIHAFPGGSADSNYNGIWPQKALFWRNTSNIGNTSVTLMDAGRMIAKAMLAWVEGLDTDALAGFQGLTFMNEPANGARHNGMLKSEVDVLNWLKDTADFFRQSSLPGLGKKLYLQVLPEVFKDFNGTVLPWWHREFSEEEQRTWLVADFHWYSTWDKACDGRTDEGGAYFCDDPVDEVRQLISKCIGRFARNFVTMFPGLRAATEFSVGTYFDARFACNDNTLLRALFEEQVKVLDQHDIEGFFWTWRMPYGQVFEHGWSLKHLAGLEDRHAEVCDASTIPFP